MTYIPLFQCRNQSKIPSFHDVGHYCGAARLRDHVILQLLPPGPGAPGRRPASTSAPHALCPAGQTPISRSHTLGHTPKISRFQDFAKDFTKISRFQQRFQISAKISRFHQDFKISAKISRFQRRFQDFS